MSVATHLGIDLAEYDARIRTFIPDYAEMLEVAASAIGPDSRVIVDLGVGTGALSARCREKSAAAKLFGIDADAAILRTAVRRVPGMEPICDSFLRAQIPACDAVIASFSLHHVRTRSAKSKLYARLRKSLRRGGQVLNVDCQPARDRQLSQLQFAAWKAHLMRFYPEREAASYLAAWAREDVYVSLEVEIALMQSAGFVVEVLWRKGAFAVLRGKRD